MEFQGAVYDISVDVMIVRAPIIRATREEAMTDALTLAQNCPGYDAGDAYVIVDGQLEY